MYTKIDYMERVCNLFLSDYVVSQSITLLSDITKDSESFVSRTWGIDVGVFT